MCLDGSGSPNCGSLLALGRSGTVSGLSDRSLCREKKVPVGDRIVLRRVHPVEGVEAVLAHRVGNAGNESRLQP